MADRQIVIENVVLRPNIEKGADALAVSLAQGFVSRDVSLQEAQKILERDAHLDRGELCSAVEAAIDGAFGIQP
jgi:hypothetical protein